MVHVVGQQLRERDVEHPVDLARVGGDDRPAVGDADERRDVELPDEVPRVGSDVITSTELGSQADLLVGLAQGGVARVVVDARLHLPTRGTRSRPGATAWSRAGA